MSSHAQRLITAMVLLPIALFLIWQGGFVFTCALAIIAILGLYEFLQLFKLYFQIVYRCVLFALAGLSFFMPVEWGVSGLVYLLLGVFWFMALYFLVCYSRTPETTDLTLFMPVVGFLYVVCTLHFFRGMISLEIYSLLACIFASDAGAFYAGKLWGNKKIWQVISPKKTWAGSVGGCILCIISALVAGYFWGKAPLWCFFLLGLTVNIASQLGDFFESGLKRWAKVKDSGNLLPGHGGLLDRLDSILFALPVYAGLNFIFSFFGN